MSAPTGGRPARGHEDRPRPEDDAAAPSSGGGAGSASIGRVLEPAKLRGRERYQLLTSLVVPRPIAWVSTRSAAGVPNLAPFSYFAAVSATPMLVAVSIGRRHGSPKDTLANIRETGAFCINVVDEAHLEAMNLTSAEAPAEVDEFRLAGLEQAEAGSVDAPYVAGAAAVLECRLFKEVELEGSRNTLVIGEVRAVRLGAELAMIPDTHFVDTASLRPVGRLWGDGYALVRDMPRHPRPGWPPA